MPAQFERHLQANKNCRSKMLQLPLTAKNNTKPISFPSPFFLPPLLTSLISDHHSHSFSHPFLLFSFIVTTPTLLDRVTLVFFPTSSAPQAGGLELKLAISCTMWDELPRNRKADSTERPLCDGNSYVTDRPLRRLSECNLVQHCHASSPFV